MLKAYFKEYVEGHGTALKKDLQAIYGTVVSHILGVGVIFASHSGMIAAWSSGFFNLMSVREEGGSLHASYVFKELAARGHA